MKSTAQKLAQCEGLLGTKDITPWETGFLRGLLDRDQRGLSGLSEKQLEVLDRIYNKHFA